jgi:TatD DNase family protein
MICIDTHCHIDQYARPEHVAHQAEVHGIQTVAVTNLPSHYGESSRHLTRFKFVHPALGLHPLAAAHHRNELPLFHRYVNSANYIGEIGLDFSIEGINSREVQLQSFVAVVGWIRERKRFVTLHSRRAEQTVLDILTQHRMYPCVFHWYSGPLNVLQALVGEGHYISINTAMIQSKRWPSLLNQVPRERIVTETDGPYIRRSGHPVVPGDVPIILKELSLKWECPIEEAADVVHENFNRLLSHS